MKNDTVVSLKKPAEESDPLSSLLREGARALLHDAVEAELATYLAAHAGARDAAGRRCLVRNGYLPERTLLTGLGEVPIRVPKTRDRAAGAGISPLHCCRRTSNGRRAWRACCRGCI